MGMMYIPGQPTGGLFNIKKWTKDHFKRLIRLKGDPFALARGAAIGTFIGITPTIPFHTILVTSLCVFLRGNVVAGILISLLVSNPLIIPIEYYLSWKIGKFVTQTPFVWKEIEHSLMLILHAPFMESIKIICYQSIQVLFSLILGGILLAIPFAFLSYFLALKFYIGIHKKRYLKDKYKVESE